jgi:hypothetical protein
VTPLLVERVFLDGGCAVLAVRVVDTDSTSAWVD